MAIDVRSLYDRRADNRWDRVAIGDILERVAHVRPDAEALIGWTGAYGDSGFARLTYADADRWANRFANALISRGLQRGDRVLMLCDNSVEGVVTKLGIAKAGGVVVPVNPRQTPAFVRHVVEVAAPAFAICDREHLPLARESDVRVDCVIPIGEGAADGDVPVLRAWCEAAGDLPPEVTIHGDDIWQILFTSGTTAQPKGVMISHVYAYMAAMGWAPTQSRGLPHEALLRSACFTPVMFHIGDVGYLMPTLLSGGSIILGRTLKPAQLAAAIAHERASAVITGNRLLALQLLDEMEALGTVAAASLTCVMHATGLLTQADVARFRALIPGVNIIYAAGQTESAGLYRFAYEAFPERHADALDRHLNLVGLPSPVLTSAVVAADAGMAMLAPESIGEFVYRTPAMMAGYYRDEAATQGAFAGGWFHSGDLGMALPDGDRVMTGRLKEIIKSGGENVACLRVEAVVELHPSVERGCVVGLPDPRWGEAVTAAVILRPGEELDEAAIIAFCRARLSGHETPKRVIAVPALPTGFGGKLLRSELRTALLSEGA